MSMQYGELSDDEEDFKPQSSDEEEEEADAEAEDDDDLVDDLPRPPPRAYIKPQHTSPAIAPPAKFPIFSREQLQQLTPQQLQQYQTLLIQQQQQQQLYNQQQQQNAMMNKIKAGGKVPRPAHLPPPNYIQRNFGGQVVYVLPAHEVQLVLDENCRFIMELTDLPMDGKNYAAEGRRQELLRLFEGNLRYLGELANDRIKAPGEA